MSDMEESGRTRKWVAVGLLLLVSYPLSFGPTCWVLMRTDHRTHPVTRSLMNRAARDVYYPLVLTYTKCPEPVQKWFCAYLDVGAPKDYHMMPIKEGILWTLPGFSHTFMWISPPKRP